MTCPRGDGELISRTATGLGGIPLTYHLCLACLGHWTRPFDANYLPLSALPEDSVKEEVAIVFRCPECQEPLERARKDAMAPDVLAWYCPSGHGYFFPRGNLRRFRIAQEARVTYHKLWNIPMPPIRSVLLASIILLGAIASTIALAQIQKQQQLETQARDILDYHDVIVSRDREATVIAHTTAKTELTLSVPLLALTIQMNSSDGLSHTYYLGTLSLGTYIYSFSYSANGRMINTPDYVLEIP